MKKIIFSLFLLLFSVPFYGQMKEEVVQIEGIYVISSETSSFYEQYDGALYSPIWLEFDKALKLDKKQQKEIGYCLYSSGCILFFATKSPF